MSKRLKVHINELQIKKKKKKKTNTCLQRITKDFYSRERKLPFSFDGNRIEVWEFAPQKEN